MKNLLLILAFVLISLTGFSQTFSYSSSQNGNTQQVFNVAVIHGGYNYSYSISSHATYQWSSNLTSIGSTHLGTIGYCTDNQSKSGSGNSGAAKPSFTSDQIIIAILNNWWNSSYISSGSASITINCY
jgi:hypothetical protein